MPNMGLKRRPCKGRLETHIYRTMGTFTTRAHVLPDLLAPSLRLVFCGTAAGRMSAATGHYYAHPQNRFWRTLHAIGLTPRLYLASEFTSLLELGIGLTDIAKFASGMDKEIPRGSLGKAAALDLERRIAAAAPKILAFTSLAAGRSYLGSKAKLGAQTRRIGETSIWVLPSPSPVAQWNWNQSIWRDLADEVARAG
jgi:TDG/mug DNA glycosylase family protein